MFPLENLIHRHPVAAYFVMTFGISWGGALSVAVPGLIRGTGIPPVTGIVMFPAMLLGPVVSGIVISRKVDGPQGTADLFERIRKWRIAARWYAALLIPSAGVLLILLLLEQGVSRVFTPNHFWMGIAFGVPAGVCEEIGWMGFAFPKMRAQLNALSAAVLLGLLWNLWHLPVINYLGAATPHRKYWLPFFLAFALAMTAMRVLIAWLYTQTNSVFLAQLMHISSTGALVIFSPRVRPAQEAMWYALYGCLLWLIVAIVVIASGRQLGSA